MSVVVVRVVGVLWPKPRAACWGFGDEEGSREHEGVENGFDQDFHE